jgi:hypothetical protein
MFNVYYVEFGDRFGDGGSRIPKRISESDANRIANSLSALAPLVEKGDGRVEEWAGKLTASLNSKPDLNMFLYLLRVS